MFDDEILTHLTYELLYTVRSHYFDEWAIFYRYKKNFKGYRSLEIRTQKFVALEDPTVFPTCAAASY